MDQKYAKPPIIEAVLQIRYAEAFGATDVQKIPRLLREEFPKSIDEADFQMEMEVGPNFSPKPTAKVTEKGFRLSDQSDQRTLIVRSSAITYSQVAPYPGWDQFIEPARSSFDTLRKKLGVRSLTKIGLRYVNRIDVPLADGEETLDPRKYLNMNVTFPESEFAISPRAFHGIMDVNLRENALWARIQAALATPALIRNVSYLLDIDVMAETDLPQRQADLWALIARMRDAKNALFEACITDESRKLFRLST